MAVRASMANLISRVRILINDPVMSTPQFPDQTIQDVLDEGRADVVNGLLIPKATYSGTTIQFLDYYSELGGWEDDYILKQYLINQVAPSAVEPIAGHFQFAETTLPPIYITGKVHDVYRASADLLERWAAIWVLRYSMSVDGQNLQRSQVATALQKLAATYRMKQRAKSISMLRSDLASSGTGAGLSLGPTDIDYISSGDGR